MKRSVIVMVSALLVSSPSFAKGNAEAGKAKAATCIACHGANGISTNPIYPNLAGQHAAYIAAQLKAFKSGERKNAVMDPFVKALSEQDMDDLGAYYESLGAASDSGGEGRRRRR